MSISSIISCKRRHINKSGDYLWWLWRLVALRVNLVRPAIVRSTRRRLTMVVRGIVALVVKA
jgi:hypothetical protein